MRDMWQVIRCRNEFDVSHEEPQRLIFFKNCYVKHYSKILRKDTTVTVAKYILKIVLLQHQK